MSRRRPLQPDPSLFERSMAELRERIDQLEPGTPAYELAVECWARAEHKERTFAAATATLNQMTETLGHLAAELAHLRRRCQILQRRRRPFAEQAYTKAENDRLVAFIEAQAGAARVLFAAIMERNWRKEVRAAVDVEGSP